MMVFYIVKSEEGGKHILARLPNGYPATRRGELRCVYLTELKVLPRIVDSRHTAQLSLGVCVAS